jgi:hypothetical protein
MSAETDRRHHYEGCILPLGAAYGDGMSFPPNGNDPGVGSLGSGETLPFGNFYDPPRVGAPETYLANNTGNEPK